MLAVTRQLEDGGLDRDLIREWLAVCWPSQVQGVIDAFPQYAARDWYDIGMKGYRGFKAGVRKSRNDAEQLLWATRLEQRKNDIERITRVNDTGSLADEFL